MHRAHRITLVAAVTALAAACTPASAAPATAPATTTAPPASTTTAPPASTTTPPTPGAPVIAAFTASRPSGATPLTTAFTWSISDPDSATLTCALDLDGNGSDDLTVGNCSSATSRTSTLSTPGSRTVRLRVSDGVNQTSATTNVVVAAAGSDAFSVTIRINGSMTPSQQAAFTTAAARWAALVKGGLADTSLSIPADDCATGTPSFSGTVDDLMIDAQITAIDGPGNILGSAGPCYTRIGGGLPVYGIMKFDSADVATLESLGRFGDTILHEMGHVLGLGTVWSSRTTGLGGADPRFTGAAAVGVWSALGGTGTVPVENTGGSGTAGGHWREATFDNELMTGWLENGANPLSSLTVAGLGDLGYTVDLGAADAYGLPALLGSVRLFSVNAEDEHDHVDLAGGEEIIRPKGAR